MISKQNFGGRSPLVDTQQSTGFPLCSGCVTSGLGGARCLDSLASPSAPSFAPILRRNLALADALILN